jgi:hypothetical protein
MVATRIYLRRDFLARKPTTVWVLGDKNLSTAQHLQRLGFRGAISVIGHTLHELIVLGKKCAYAQLLLNAVTGGSTNKSVRNDVH